jgi:hypothetical protein
VKHWKIYLVLLVHKRTKALLAKVGITSQYEILDRFNYDPRWKERFTIQVFARINVSSYELAYAWEQWLHSQFRKNIWLEVFLGTEDGNWEDLHGITECFAVHTGTSYADVEFPRQYGEKEHIVVLPHLQAVTSLFKEVKDKIKYEIEPPKPDETTYRVYAKTSLTLEEVQHASNK